MYKTRKGCEAMEENKLAIQNELSYVDIRNLIYTIRGKQVMLDSDVAMLYHYETKNVNKAVKRNIDRFPEDFCFQLTKDEMDKMWFQNGTTSKGENNKYRSEQYLPYAFTEQGIAMLSGVLKNNIAIAAIIKPDTENTELLKLANVYITKPINSKVLVSCINGSLKLKKAIDTLSTNNSELAKSLYQLDVLYNTSTQLAGSLDKQKLINIIN